MVEQEINRNIYVLALTTLLSGFYGTLLWVMWQPFILSIFQSVIFVGLLESLSGWRGIVTTIIQPFSGFISDRKGRKQFLVLGGTLNLLASTIYLSAAYTMNKYLVVLGALLWGSAALSWPALDSLIAESVKTRRRGLAYSLISFAGTLPGIFSPLLGGKIADELGYPPLFILGIGVEITVIALYIGLIKETLRKHVNRFSIKEKLFDMVKQTIRVPSGLKTFYLIMALDMFSWGCGEGIIFSMLKDSFNLNNSQIGLLGSLTCTSWAASQLPIGKLIMKHGSKKFLILSEVIGVIIMTGYLVNKTYISFMVLSLLFGLAISTWDPAMKTLLMNRAPVVEKAHSIGKLSLTRGLIAFPAPFIGGLLYSFYGFNAPITANLIGVTTAAILIQTSIKD